MAFQPQCRKRVAQPAVALRFDRATSVTSRVRLTELTRNLVMKQEIFCWVFKEKLSLWLDTIQSTENTQGTLLILEKRYGREAREKVRERATISLVLLLGSWMTKVTRVF